MSDTVTDTFTFTCPWGCTVHVVAGQERPHACHGASLVLDAMRVAPVGVTNLEYAESVARTLTPQVRVLIAEACECGPDDR